MKRFLLFVLICLSLSFSTHVKRKFSPPGTIRITETFYADETEISNLSWLEYEFWVGQKFGFHSKEYLNACPETLVWSNSELKNHYLARNYYRAKKYRDYPVVGISYEQAIEFCKWRTERVKEFYQIKYKKGIDITYRLPTKEEWELLSNNGSRVIVNKGKNEKGFSLLNCLSDTTEFIGNNVITDSTDVCAPTYSYWANRFGIYNMFGNVAEMIDEKGICKGGSWMHKLEECRAGKDIRYHKPEAWLGFRCVCVLKIKNK